MTTFQLHELTSGNEDFRRELVTGAASQLVAMTLREGEAIGAEVHEHGDQILLVTEGEAEVVLDGDSRRVPAGGGAFVRAGVEHDVRNAGSVPLRLLSIYAPAEHEPGTVHTTKAEADAAEHDQH